MVLCCSDDIIQYLENKIDAVTIHDTSMVISSMLFITKEVNSLFTVIDTAQGMGYCYNVPKASCKLEIVDQRSTRIPLPHRRGWLWAMGGLQLNIIQNHKAAILKAT